MANMWERFIEYRKERQHIRDVLSADNQNFW
jgi:protein involved in ribonucleotide reduction